MLQDVNGSPIPQGIIVSINHIDNAIDAFAVEYCQIDIKKAPSLTNTELSLELLTTVLDGLRGLMLSSRGLFLSSAYQTRTMPCLSD